MTSFTIEGKRVDVFASEEPDSPVIYLNTFGEEGEQVFQYLRERDCPPFSLVSISDLDWNHDMAPWDAPSLSKRAEPFTGGANAYLKLLTSRILPKAEEALPGRPSWRGIAGYSLAGLFALYSIYQTDVFSRAASMSGSLWFPGIKEFITSHAPKRKPDRLYFSLGDKESHTRNKLMKCVQQNTESIATFYQEQGIDTDFQLNPGNHFQDSVPRTAAGIEWLLKFS